MDRIDPWEVKEIKDYPRLMKEFGIENFSQFSNRLKDAPLEIKSSNVFQKKKNLQYLQV